VRQAGRDAADTGLDSAHPDLPAKNPGQDAAETELDSTHPDLPVKNPDQDAAETGLPAKNPGQDAAETKLLFLKKIEERQSEIAFAFGDKQEVVVRHVRFMVQ
jgi:hypothetical protein